MVMRILRSPMLDTKVTPIRMAGVNTSNRDAEARAMKPSAVMDRQTTTKPTLAWAPTSGLPLFTATMNAR